METGYSLCRMELYNWGNFQGWQSFELKDSELSLGGPLWAPPSHSLIAGVNGSGKSTLIDGMMVVLLPFQASLRLGVTHDSELGTGGGRGVKDYVLGKYASTGGERIQEGQGVFSRKKGCSLLLLVFRHNQQHHRLVSLGRVWWYSRQSIKEEGLSFISQEDLSIANKKLPNLLDAQGSLYPSAREFRQGLKGRPIQIFDKVNAYFQGLSQVFGGVTKDDLKLLNRAFYLKSVGQIDPFIRHYMLLEQNNESMDRLMQHVEHAAEISANMELCETKLKAMSRIIKGLRTYQRHLQEKFILSLKERLILIYPTWLDAQAAQVKVDQLESTIEETALVLPRLTEKIKEENRELDRLRSLLAKNQAAASIKNIELELETLEERAFRWKNHLEKAQKFCLELKLRQPKSSQDLKVFVQACQAKQEKLLQLQGELETSRSELLLRAKDLEEKRKRLRGELQFLSEHPTLIPESLYAIKKACLKSLGLAPQDLLFVGELLSLKPHCQNFARAVEAALNPIARNLLCVPNQLGRVTRWINQTGLKKTLTIKRIKEEEMKPLAREDFPDSSILAKIELREPKENPFYDYLLNWLSKHFYHRIVGLEAFKQAIDKAVTLEGLVKTDGRTMRKLREDFAFSLGWDNQKRQEEIGRELQQLSSQAQALNKRLEESKAKLEVLQRENFCLKSLEEQDWECLQLPDLAIRRQELQKELKSLREANLEYEKLSCQAEASAEALTKLQNQKAECAAQLKHDKQQLENCKKIILEKTREVERHLLSALPSSGKSLQSHLPEFSLSLESLQEELKTQKLSHSAYGSKLQEEIENLRHRLISNPVAHYMREYESLYRDPNLSYQLGDEDSIALLIKEWESAKENLETTGLPQVKAKWENFYNHTLVESIKTAINEIRMEQNKIEQNIRSINQVLKCTDFEKLPQETRYLQIKFQNSSDERVRQFQRDLRQVETAISGPVRHLETSEAAQAIVKTLLPFVNTLKEDLSYRKQVTDIRNHYEFKIHSHRRLPHSEEKKDSVSPKEQADPIVETFAGAKKDAKSSAQTTHLAYTLLASSLAYRFHFHDPVKGKNTLRLLILDEFGGKFDNEKPKDILKLLQDMGFQSILVTPMAKADLLADYIGQLVLVHKASASTSKVQSHLIQSREDYEKIVHPENREESAA